MSRPITLFTGQWTDLPLATLAAECGEWDFDGLELACWGDHFDVAAALVDPGYAAGRRQLLEQHGPGVWAIGNHLVWQGGVRPDRRAPPGRAPARRLGGRRPGGRPPARRQDDEGHGARGRAARRRARHRLHGLADLAPALLVPAQRLERGRARLRGVRRALGPIVDVFEAEGMKLALEVQPTEIAYDFVTTRKALAALGERDGFGINFDPTHFEHQFLDSGAFVTEFGPKIYHVHVKDSPRRLDGHSSILGGHLDFGQPGRGWDFVSPGHGDVDFDFESIIRALNGVGYDGPLPIEWEDSGMDREWGAQDALAFVRRTDFAPSRVIFDAAFAKDR